MTEQDYAKWADVAADEVEAIRAYVSTLWAWDWDCEEDEVYDDE